MKTTSRELSEKLVALGVEIESYFVHKMVPLGGTYLVPVKELNIHERKVSYPAPTACELMEVLPFKMKSHGHTYLLAIYKEPKNWYLGYECGDIYEGETYADNPADALALMLIWLIEEGHLTVEEINERRNTHKRNAL